MNNLPSAQDSKFNVACILMHDRITYDALFISCNELHATAPTECNFEFNVACILMHDRTTHYSFRATSCTLRRDLHTELEPHKPLFLLHFNLFNASRTLSGAIFSLCCCTKFLTQSGWVLPYSRNAQPMALLMKNSD